LNEAGHEAITGTKEKNDKGIYNKEENKTIQGTLEHRTESRNKRWSGQKGKLWNTRLGQG
jgi:hypothetical protein